MKKIQIGYVTEDISPAYSKAIRDAKNKEELVGILKFYMPVTPDALKVAKKFTDADFVDFQRDIRKANRKQSQKWCEKFNERFGIVAMPIKMVIASMMADKFHVPWGCAFIRGEERGWK